MKKINMFTVIATLGTMLSYYIFGFADSTRGAVMSEFLESNNLPLDFGGTIAILHYGGFCVAVLLFGLIAYALPKKVYLLSANIASLVGVMLFAYASGWLMITGIFMLGFSLGLYEFCGNAVIRDIYPENKRAKYVNILASIHSVGAIIAPLILGAVLLSGMNWRVSFNAVIPVIILSTIIFIFIKWKNNSSEKIEKSNIKDYGKAFVNKATISYYAIAFLYIAAEAGIIIWMSSYLELHRGYVAETAAMWLSVFFACVAIGRFAGGFIVDIFGYNKILTIATILGGSFILLGTILPTGFEVLIPFSGIALSVTFPTVAAAISLECKGKEDTTMGAFYFFSAVGGAFGGTLVSALNSWLGMKEGFISLAIMCFTAGIIALLVTIRKRKTAH